MSQSKKRDPRAVAVAGAVVSLALAALLAPAVALAHTPQTAGEYTLEIGWKVEPAYVGQPNAVEVTVTDHHGAPVLDVAAEALKVVVSTAGRDTQPLVLEPAFDATEKTGPLGEYDAALIPTAVGDYAFHVTGQIGAQAIDVSVTSGPETFDPVKGAADLQFPAKLPSLDEVATRLDRIDARIAALQSAAPAQGPDAGAAVAASAAARDAAATADRATWIALGLGAVAIVIALAALLVALRARRSLPR